MNEQLRHPEWREAGERLREFRLEQGFTQEQLAAKAGLDRSQLNQMERGNRGIGPQSREKLAEALNKDPEELEVPALRVVDWKTVPNRVQQLEIEVTELREALDLLREAVEALPGVELAEEARTRGSSTSGKRQARQRK